MTPKEIIFDQIKDKLKEANIIKAIISFNVLAQTNSVMLLQENNKPLKIEIEKKEMTLLRLVFINKIRRKFEKDYRQEMKSIFLQFDLNADKFDIFIENTKDKTIKFEY